MKKRFACVCLLVLFVFLLGGCAKPHTDKEVFLTSNGEPTVTTTTTTTSSPSTTLSSTSDFTTTKTDPSHPVFLTKVSPEDFHTDIIIRLDKSIYTTKDTVKLEIENKTNDKISFSFFTVFLKQGENDEWQVFNDKTETVATVYELRGSNTLGLFVNLEHYDLEANRQYRLATKVSEKWVYADFETVTPPKTSAVPSSSKLNLPTGDCVRPLTFPTKLKQEDFHTDIVMRLDKSVYTTEDIVEVEIENKTESKISVGCNFVVLKQKGSDEWQLSISKGGYPALLHNIEGNSTFKTSVKLEPYELKANEQYKLALGIDGKFVCAEFKTISPSNKDSSPTTTTKPVPTTTISSKLPTTTTTTGRSRYTSSTKLKPEDFHTDIVMRLDKSVYTTEDTVQIEIENKTGGEISFGYHYYVLKQEKNDEWTKIYHGQGTIAAWRIMKGNGSFKTSVKLAPYELAANEQYKLALEIEGKWVAADFETIAAPKTNPASTTTRSPELSTATVTSRRANIVK